jgi:Ser/Thr protein kinase RdoA (MazF antagonist)
VSRTATAATPAETLERLGDPPRWLGAIADPAAVERALLPHIPGLRSCDVVRVRTKSTGMGAVYLADVAGAGAVELHGHVSEPRPPAGAAVAEPGWRRYLPDLRLVVERGDADAALPALASMTDSGAAAGMIERLLDASGRCPGIRVAACTSRVMRHKPGSRCTVAYELELAPDAPADWPRAVVAKTYWGGKGRVAWDGMRDLWHAPVAAAGTVALAEPLAFSAGDRVVLQRSIPHRTTLKAMLRASLGTGAGDTAALVAALRRSGRGLAELHACGVHAPDERSWADERAEVSDIVGRLAVLVPSLDGAVAGLLDTLDHRIAAAGEEPAVPSHGSFRPAQVVVGDDGTIGFIDFDSFCLAEPAADCALFCSSLRDTGLRTLREARGSGDAGHLARLDALAAAFLDAYAGVAPVSRERVELWEALDALTGVLHCWTKAKLGRLQYRLVLLRHALDRAGVP